MGGIASIADRGNEGHKENEGHEEVKWKRELSRYYLIVFWIVAMLLLPLLFVSRGYYDVRVAGTNGRWLWLSTVNWGDRRQWLRYGFTRVVRIAWARFEMLIQQPWYIHHPIGYGQILWSRVKTAASLFSRWLIAEISVVGYFCTKWIFNAFPI